MRWSRIVQCPTQLLNIANALQSSHRDEVLNQCAWHCFNEALFVNMSSREYSICESHCMLISGLGFLIPLTFLFIKVFWRLDKVWTVWSGWESRPGLRQGLWTVTATDEETETQRWAGLSWARQSKAQPEQTGLDQTLQPFLLVFILGESLGLWVPFEVLGLVRCQIP